MAHPKGSQCGRSRRALNRLTEDIGKLSGSCADRLGRVKGFSLPWSVGLPGRSAALACPLAAVLTWVAAEEDGYPCDRTRVPYKRIEAKEKEIALDHCTELADMG